eukprot:GHVT01011397.1.p1 GENE.GHVT01011397.1~~GHVT01011397.1.p1  ORF type:complete len:300 (-),score=71.98 GHVT01011397.1:138-1037(-)
MLGQTSRSLRSSTCVSFVGDEGGRTVAFGDSAGDLWLSDFRSPDGAVPLGRPPDSGTGEARTISNCMQSVDAMPGDWRLWVGYSDESVDLLDIRAVPARAPASRGDWSKPNLPVSLRLASPASLRSKKFRRDDCWRLPRRFAFFYDRQEGVLLRPSSDGYLRFFSLASTTPLAELEVAEAWPEGATALSLPCASPLTRTCARPPTGLPFLPPPGGDGRAAVAGEDLQWVGSWAPPQNEPDDVFFYSPRSGTWYGVNRAPPPPLATLAALIAPIDSTSEVKAHTHSYAVVAPPDYCFGIG